MTGITLSVVERHAGLMAVLAKEIPRFDPNALHHRPSDLGVDSFGEMVLRGSLEQAAGREFTDEDWLGCESLGDMIALCTATGSKFAPGGSTAKCPPRQYRLGMPQLTTSGLSESWLLKETGDYHWALVGAALGSEPHEIADADGNRLYATVSRLSWSATGTLAAFAEGDGTDLKGTVSRCGQGLYLGSYDFAGPRGIVTLQVMTAFALRDKFAPHGGLSLASPQSSGDAFASSTMPTEFLTGYRQVRQEPLPASRVASSTYEIVPERDINAVGLLYFAAYPVIADICDRRLGTHQDEKWRPTGRDICYLGNCRSNDTLLYTVHSNEAVGQGCIRKVASLTRSSDDAAIALLATEYAPR